MIVRVKRPPKTRFRLLAKLYRTGLITRMVPTKGFKLSSCSSSSFPKLRSAWSELFFAELSVETPLNSGKNSPAPSAVLFNECLRAKGQLELEASVFVDVPVQRRKSRGKMRAVEGKIAQVAAKRRLTEDKIVTEIQAAYAALLSAFEQVQQARKAVAYAEDLAQRERRNFDLGASDLLKVTLREQYAAESAQKVVDALLLYFVAKADYRAALGKDRLLPTVP